MTLEHRLKKILINGAADLILKNNFKSPERCARNLLELGKSAYPDLLTKAQAKELYGDLLNLCRDHETQKAKELFVLKFGCSLN